MRVGAGTFLSLHYPPDTVEKLRLIAPTAPPVGDWMTILQMAKAIGRSEKWVRTRVKARHSHLAETRIKDQSGIAAPHYPPSVLEVLKAEADAVKPANGLITLGDIEREVGRSKAWCKRVLQDLGITGEERRPAKGRTICLHFPSWVVVSLKSVADSIPEAGDWVTIYQIAQTLGKDPSWVKNRTKQLGYEPEERADGTQRVYDYYPPTIVEELRKLL